MIPQSGTPSPRLRRAEQMVRPVRGIATLAAAAAAWVVFAAFVSGFHRGSAVDTVVTLSYIAGIFAFAVRLTVRGGQQIARPSIARAMKRRGLGWLASPLRRGYFLLCVLVCAGVIFDLVHSGGSLIKVGGIVRVIAITVISILGVVFLRSALVGTARARIATPQRRSSRAFRSYIVVVTALSAISAVVRLVAPQFGTSQHTYTPQLHPNVSLPVFTQPSTTVQVAGWTGIDATSLGSTGIVGVAKVYSGGAMQAVCFAPGGPP